MRGRGGAVVGLLIIIVGFILFPILLTAFDDLDRTEVETSATVTTAGVTTGNLTLNSGLYNANLDNVIEISSSDTDDDPAPNSYNSSTDALEVSGLQQSTSRTLTVSYYTERDTGYISTLLPIVPFIIFLLFLGAGCGIMYKSLK